MTNRAVILFAVMLCASLGSRADQLEMQNGDRYAGKVVSITSENIILQSDVLGRITLPRNKVANINLGAPVAKNIAPPTNHSAGPSLVMTNANPDISAALRNLGANTNFIEQVRKQFLGDAGPDANKKYDDLVGGLLNGSVDINSLRAQAKGAADQIRALKGQGGENGGADDMLDSYLTILDSFLKDTANTPSSAPTTNGSPATTLTK